MGNAKYTRKAQRELIKLNNELTDLVNEMTNNELLPDKLPFEVGNPFPLLVVDDYLSGNIHDGLFVEKLNKCEEDLKKFESLIPTLTLLDIDFSQILNKIQYISEFYINKYETDYKEMLAHFIEIEKEKSIKSGILINTSLFLNINQYKRLYDICSSVKATIKSNHSLNDGILFNYKEALNDLIKENNPQQPEMKTEPETIEMKPVLKPEAVQIVFDIIKDFFCTEQQIELKKILETGNNTSKKLLFNDKGNRLNDTFKKLIEHDFIIGCQKQDLINWIISNFSFLRNKTVTEFKPDTVEKTISRNYYPCKSPLIEIKNGQIQKVEKPHVRNQNKY